MATTEKRHRAHEKVPLTPVQIAGRQFRSHLSEQAIGMTTDSLNGYMELVEQHQEIRHMHMPTLAGLIHFLHDTGLKIERETLEDSKFNFDNMVPYIRKIHRYEEAYKHLYKKRSAVQGEEKSTLGERVRANLDQNTAATFVRYLYTLTEEPTAYETLLSSKSEPHQYLSDEEQDGEEDAYSEEDDDIYEEDEE